MSDVFYAYPSGYFLITETIESASKDVTAAKDIRVKTWPQVDIAGRFIASEILQEIRHAAAVVADVSYLNFNVTFEIGYAIGIGKPLVVTRLAAVAMHSNKLIDEVGIFDTLGYSKYDNRDDLGTILAAAPSTPPLAFPRDNLNSKAPVYLIETKFKTDAATRIISRVKKAGLFYRSFDPTEQARLSAPDAIANVAQSYGVLLHLLPKDIEDSPVHNQRVAFLAGLAVGMGKVLMLLQQGNDPVPLDYRDLIRPFYTLDQINEAIADFSPEVSEALQQGAEPVAKSSTTLLERVHLGASSAENELKDLSQYYLQTDAFRRAHRGDVRLVVGRKGAGKTAVFAQVRDDIRRNKQKIVLDLRPDGYKLLKFKEAVLDLLAEGTFYHTITAFWEYLLLLELCHKLLQKDKTRHTRDNKYYEPYRRLASLYQGDSYIAEGDFSERMSRLIDSVSERQRTLFADKARLSAAEVTQLIYMHDVSALRHELKEYLTLKDDIWLLFDNLDKGWPTHGLSHEDVIIIRSLAEATRKIEQYFNKHDIAAHTIIFIRNDVYELLVEESPDRGKETKAILDWTDPDLLREMLRLRLVNNVMRDDASFTEAWRSICVSHIDGEESSQFFIDRCLMRPRCLIDIVNYCRGSAVNLGHARIEREDAMKGLHAYSTDLVFEIGLEMRDILPAADGILYRFIKAPATLTREVLSKTLACDSAQLEEALIENFLWYGFLGVETGDDSIDYIYSVNYDMNMLRGLIDKQGDRVVFCINPAFWMGLRIQID